MLVNAGAAPDPGLFPADRTLCWEWWAQGAAACTAAGYATVPDPVTGAIRADEDADDGPAAILVALPAQRDHALGLLAAAHEVLRPGGLLVVAGGNDSGGRRLADDLGPHVDTLHTTAKYKSRIVWYRKQAGAAMPESWRDGVTPRVHPGHGLWSVPGIFSWDRIDPASALLIPHIPEDQTGVFVDAGCGYGAITLAIARRNPQAARIIAIDADARALAMCRRNVEDVPAAARIETLWADFTAGKDGRIADFVVMNPPFHHGKHESIVLGQGFIARAAAILRPGGRLLMVANVHLPYERTLHEHFRDIDRLHETGGFKIFSARV